METTPQYVHEPVQILKFKFLGSANEYFRIWIVNTLLTVVTVGIYSAWAKVRSKKYLYQHTILEGSTFDYHASPLNILKGRMIIGIVLVIFGVGGKISPIIGIFAYIPLVGLIPWIVVRGNIFNLGNTSYRNIRFGFTPSYSESYKTYFKGIAIAILTLGLGYYYIIYLHIRFRANHAKYGNIDFNFFGESGAYRRIIIKLVLISSMFLGVGFLFLFALSLLVGRSAMSLIVLVVYSAFFIGWSYMRAKVSNYNFDHLKLGDIRFRCDLNWVTFAQIYLTNFFAIIFSLGLLIPWARIRTLKYRLNCMRIILPDGVTLNQFIAARSLTEGAVSDAAVDFWDMDVGF